MEVQSAAMLLLLALQAAAQEVKYFEIGGNLNLDPKPSEAITAITWKHKGNIAVEYIKDAVDLEYLGDLKGRLKLNVTTGILTISNMEKSDDGEFTVEVNNRALPVRFNVVGVKSVPEPVLVLNNPTCYKNSDSCNLTCKGDIRDSGPVRYFWKLGEYGPWLEAEQDWMFTAMQKALVEKIICKIQNPISERESGPLQNLLFPPGCSFISEVLGVVMRSVALLVLSSIAVWFFWQNRNTMCRCRTKEDSQA
ncbi:uncharacterized protein LOC116713314 [Xiphophorus hellerii]|uniref:uncharacterized protein LOC116713314 n=1 Tax=Xiphophorus hellerii TaxID=8084 RepID=UPI0013B3B861|nr:uncharacterized protein LOC116713314 [Xiphophorus hellerii]